MSFQRILMPIDHTTDAVAASEYSRQIGFVMNADLFVLNVSNVSARPDIQPHSVPMTVRAGDPALEIVRYADEIDAGLLVMPARRYGIIKQLLLGSTTMDVIRRTRRSVWITSKRSLKRPICFVCRRIVCGINLGKETATVLKYASDLAATWNAEMIVVHASPWLSGGTLDYQLLNTDETVLLPQIALRRMLERDIGSDVSSALEVTTGDVADVLRNAALKHCADLLVIGRGTHTTPWQFGTNIGKIISRVPCPVLTYDGR